MCTVAKSEIAPRAALMRCRVHHAAVLSMVECCHQDG